MLLGAKGIATRNKKVLGAPGRTTRSDRTPLVARMLQETTGTGRLSTVSSFMRTGCPTRIRPGAPLSIPW